MHDQSKGTLYLIMEYFEGDTIEEYVTKFENKLKKSPKSPSKHDLMKLGDKLNPQKIQQQKSVHLIKEELI